ncbi:LysR family transcriptional regulator [Aliiroseovarius subalbicans]|uniref:LysR family transcriptional regulator n=1 Tax=Aliiroseovarius subalbicans TaxID=2925840 RepID=UPI001F5980BC|nr:LysR family transcriptional regulator [Aliiroseovarius subalbicans]MCI2398516.1 LysR family transcriptional regulator [Aliiroseovarius subalbicans]
MNLKIDMLRCFATVAETGTLADAAHRLGRTPSALSMTLKQLEAHLGGRLFETDRKTRLTPLGQYVEEQALNALGAFDGAVSAIEAFARAPGGLLRVAAVPSVAGLVLPGAVAQVTRAHPGLRVDLSDMDSAGVLRALMQGQVELGIASPPGPTRGVQSETLFADDFGLVCAPDHRLAQQTDDPDLAQLSAHGLISNPLSAAIEDPRVQTALSHSRITAQNTLSLLAMVKTGDWVTILPRSVIRIDPAGLMFRPIRDVTAKRQVDLLTRSDARDSTHLTAFTQILKDMDWQGL